MYNVSGGPSVRDCLLLRVYYKLRQMMTFKNTGPPICLMLGMCISFRKVMIRIPWIQRKQLSDTLSDLTFVCPCIVSIIVNYDQKDSTILA